MLRLLSALLLLPTVSRTADTLPADQVEFFEKRIRPVLVESCHRCHSAEAGQAKGGLKLDTREAVLRGGQSGPALVPGQPDTSLLIRAVRYADPDLEMPPQSAGGKLSEAVIADLVAWVAMGAPDPRGADAGKPGAPSNAAAQQHWAFQPVKAPGMPTVRDPAAVRTPVDHFVRAKLETRGLSPAPPADRRTLLRRLHYDLTGLPPTLAEVAAFEADTAPGAVERVVDRLLASPHYGERWGRHWLDVARYADTKGYVFQEERRYPFSHTYRDYVIRAFNDDTPFDRFLVEQLAADLVVSGEDRSALAALGFLTLGRRFLNNPHDIIDDRIDVVTRGTMALTVSCARCHDHKFEPVSMRDYYALHGIFASSEEPAEKPLLRPLVETPEYRDYLQARAAIEAEIEQVAQREIDAWLTAERGRVGDYLLAAHEARSLPPAVPLATFAGERQVVPLLLERWLAFLDRCRATPEPVFAPWLALCAAPNNAFADAATACLAGLETPPEGRPRPNPRVLAALREPLPTNLVAAAAAYGRVFAEADRAWRDALAGAAKSGTAAPTLLPDADLEALRQVLYADAAPANPPVAGVRALIERQIDNQTVGHRQRIEALQWTHPGAPLRAMALADRAEPRNSPLLRRGNPSQPGPEVPRRFLELFGDLAPAAFTNGSGRLELARAVTSRENPLTARVFVNRVWGWHFGTPLVRTPGDFGVRTEAPVQLDLLDWLAADFMDHGWSVKRLHRQIVLSATYQQSSQASPEAEAADPENQWLHHAPRRRLEFEPLRDTLLAVSGTLDPALGGLPVDLWTEPFTGRRSVYGFIDRQNLPGVFRTFDFPNPDTSSSGRFTTTVPQQGLFLLNHPFVATRARALLDRPPVRDAATDPDRVARLHELVFQRSPEAAELELALDFLRAGLAGSADGAAGAPAGNVPDAPAGAPRWQLYAQALLLSNEVAFLD